MKQRSGEQTGAEPDWQELGPLVDEGLSKLRRDDRDALMLRFFEQKSLRDVGAAFGISEDAANKRVARALGRLRDFFLRRGITTADAASALALLGGGTDVAPQVLREALIAIGAKSAATSAAAGSSLAAAAQGAAVLTGAKIAGIAAAALITCGLGAVLYVESSRAPTTAQAAAAAPAAVSWQNDAGKQALLAARDECFPPQVWDFLVVNRTLLATSLNLVRNQPLMTQATAIDHNTAQWTGIVMCDTAPADRTLRIGNTSYIGLDGVVTRTGSLFPVERVSLRDGSSPLYRVSSVIDEPWAEGELKSFCWLMRGNKATRPLADGSQRIRLMNHSGHDCVQQLVLVLPSGWQMRSSSEPAASTHKVGDFVLHLWQKTVAPDEPYAVNVVVERTPG